MLMVGIMRYGGMASGTSLETLPGALIPTGAMTSHPSCHQTTLSNTTRPLKSPTKSTQPSFTSAQRNVSIFTLLDFACLIPTYLLLDWVFLINDIYHGCDKTPEECEALGAFVIHSFNKFVDAPNNLTVTCEEGKRSDGLPDWTWRAEGYEYTKYMPSCYDPTFCEKPPPAPTSAVMYPSTVEPGTYKFEDGEVITYQCRNPSKLDNDTD